MGRSPVKGVPVAGWLDYGYETTKQTRSIEASNELSKEDKEVDNKKPIRKVTEDANVFIQVPIIRQSTDYSCGAACLLSVMGYYGIDPYEKQVMDALKTTIAGVDPIDFPKAAKKFDLTAKVKEGMSQDEIKKNLDDDIPVRLDIQAWGDKKDYSDVWDEGHFVVAVGYDKEGYYLMDPSQIGYTYITKPELDTRWHDVEIGTKRKFHNVGIVVNGKKPKFRYNAVKIIE
jgi:predicted double-glycine peptidase